MKKVVIQEWEESERGWGVRPDGFTMYVDMAAHAAHIEADRAQKAEDFKRTHAIPDEYSRPSGDPYLIDVDDEVFAKIEAAPKRYIWGEGNRPKGK